MLDMLWPIGARPTRMGSCGWRLAASGLAKTFSTPLYVFDEATLRTRGAPSRTR